MGIMPTDSLNPYPADLSARRRQECALTLSHARRADVGRLLLREFCDGEMRSGKMHRRPAPWALTGFLFKRSPGNILLDVHLTVRARGALKQNGGHQSLRSRVGLVWLLVRHKDVHRHVS